MKIYNNITELIGNTPLVRINKCGREGVTLLAKLEYFNPGNSIKDRVAYNMLKNALDKGIINKNTLIIEPTSGNTGIGLAMCAAVFGLKIILTMPESMSEERKKMVKGYGAKIVLTPKEKGMQGSLDKALELKKENPDSFIPSQFDNPDNPLAHKKTAMEIWEDSSHKVTKIFAGVGTGGTISGVGHELKKLNPEIKLIAIEPFESPLLTQGHPGAHKIQGIGANFIPKNLDLDIIDKIVSVKGDDAIMTSRKLAKEEGILCGISSGAAFYAALEYSVKDDVSVVIMPDYGERYVSTELFE